MEFLLEALFQFVGEILLQVFFEFLVEFGFRSLAETFKRLKSPLLATIGFAIWGGAAGLLSLMIFPTSLVHDPILRQLNLVVTPAIAGTVTAIIGSAMAKRRRGFVFFSRFRYTFVFAFWMALVRFMWAA